MNIRAKTENIRTLNDRFRTTGEGGRQLITSGVQEMGPTMVTELCAMIADMSDFPEDSDPYHEHDFGSISFQGQTIFWKIDYYDTLLFGGSPDPSDAALTTRVLTIMLACEY